MVPRRRRATAAARGVFRYAGPSGAEGAPRAGGAGDAPRLLPEGQGRAPAPRRRQKPGFLRPLSGRRRAAAEGQAGPGRRSRRSPHRPHGGDAAGTAVPWQRRAEPAEPPPLPPASLPATFRLPCECGGGPGPGGGSRQAAPLPNKRAERRRHATPREPRRPTSAPPARRGGGISAAGETVLCVCVRVRAVPAGSRLPRGWRRSGGPARPPRPPLRGGGERPSRRAAPSAGAEGGPPLRGPLREWGAPAGGSGVPPRARGGPTTAVAVAVSPVLGSLGGVRGGQVGDEWFQHRGGQPGWASRRPLLRPELLPHRRRGPLRAPRRQRVLQQEDPEEHLAEEAEAGHRQKCELRPPPVLPPAAEPRPREEPAGRAVPFPARHRTAVPPGEAALPAPRLGGRPAESCFSARRVELCDCPAGFTGPLQAAGRGVARGDALWCKLGSSGPRFPIISVTTLR